MYFCCKSKGMAGAESPCWAVKTSSDSTLFAFAALSDTTTAAANFGLRFKSASASSGTLRARMLVNFSFSLMVIKLSCRTRGKDYRSKHSERSCLPFQLVAH